MNLGYFDYDLFVWPQRNEATIKSDEILFKNNEYYSSSLDWRDYSSHFIDDIHPKPAYSSMAAEIFLHESYSSSLVPPKEADMNDDGDGNDEKIKSKLSELEKIYNEKDYEKKHPMPYLSNSHYMGKSESKSVWDYGVNVYLITSEKEININTLEKTAKYAWLYDKRDGKRYNNLNVKFLQLSKLGPHNVLTISKTKMWTIVKGESISLQLNALVSCHLLRTMLPPSLSSSASSVSSSAVSAPASSLKPVPVYFLHYMQSYLRRIDNTTVINRLLPLIHPEINEHEHDHEHHNHNHHQQRRQMTSSQHLRKRHGDRGVKYKRRILNDNSTIDTAIATATENQSKPLKESHYCSNFPSQWLDILPYGATVWYDTISEGDVSGTKETARIDSDDGDALDIIFRIPNQYYFNNFTSLLLRIQSQAAVYLIHKGKRHVVQSMQEMMTLGRDFDQVYVISWKHMEQVCKVFACEE
jgi:hypothetical protein